MKELLEYNLDLNQERSKWRIVSTHPNAKKKLIYVQEVGDFYAGTDYYTKREGVSSFLLKLTLSGGGTLWYRGVEYTVRHAEFFLIDCKELQYYETSSTEENWHVMWVHFRGANARAYYEIFNEKNGKKPVGQLRDLNEAVHVINRLLLLYSEDNTGIKTDVEASLLLTELLALCITSSTEQEGNIVPQTVNFLKEYISKNYDKKLSLDSLSVACSTSKYHMQRLFKKHTGQTPAEYILFVRISKAKELLRTGNLSVDEIAYLVGIENVSYFINIFKKQVGTTPHRFRKSWIKYNKD